VCVCVTRPIIIPRTPREIGVQECRRQLTLLSPTRGFPSDALESNRYLRSLPFPLPSCLYDGSQSSSCPPDAATWKRLSPAHSLLQTHAVKECSVCARLAPSLKRVLITSCLSSGLCGFTFFITCPKMEGFGSKIWE
jgi:hypothetical protein